MNRLLQTGEVFLLQRGIRGLPKILSWNLPYKFPACYGIRHIAIGVYLSFFVTCAVREQPRIFLLVQIFQSVPFFLRYWRQFLWNCRRYCRIVEPLSRVGTILFGIAITLPSKAGISVLLEAVEEIEYRLFGFGATFFFGGYLCRRCLHEL